MRIGFDAKRAAQNATGLGNYSRFVIRILKNHFPEDEQVLYVPNPKKTQHLDKAASNTDPRFPQGIWQRLRSIWRVWGVTSDLKRDRIDLFHGLSNELPLNIRKAGCRSVVTIHDLIFLHYPKYYHLIDRKIYDFKFRLACRNADRVIAVSEFTKREIMKYYGTPEAKIDVVYQGCDPAFAAPFSKEKLDDVALRYSLPRQFILYVGSIEERKNLMLVAKAIALRPSAFSHKIVAVGKRTPYVDEIRQYLEANGIADRILFFHKVPFADLPSFYRLADAFVYPSRIEGFGIPMLEAISSGLPAIGCTGSCLEEAGGPHCIYVDPDDAQAMSAALCRVVSDKELRETMIREGYKYARNFTDEVLAGKVHEVYSTIFQA